MNFYHTVTEYISCISIKNYLLVKIENSYKVRCPRLLKFSLFSSYLSTCIIFGVPTLRSPGLNAAAKGIMGRNSLKEKIESGVCKCIQNIFASYRDFHRGLSTCT